MGTPEADAETDADWAWPGTQFDIYADGSFKSCSVGYPAWDASGNRYFITAGHCFRDDSGRHYIHTDGTALDIYAPSDHNTPIGFEKTYPIGKDGWYTDISLVKMYPGMTLDGYGWKHIPDNPITSDVGDTACLVGQNHSKPNCGVVTETNTELTITGFPWSTAVTRASYCSHPGDSGGAVYNRNGALGITVTGSSEHNEPGTPGACSSTYITISRVLTFLRRFHPTLSI
ncbi:trypsin-like serine protease [Mycolicibacterium mageritense]|uniref:trypsin-like serine protease n=1 Tax=Mycolicibacterium mageritense TaxID=53462 RepID=UPI0025737D4F|nr:trypsin-like serine protease [Mycolicibacterium mageritense]